MHKSIFGVFFMTHDVFPSLQQSDACMGLP